MVKCPISKASRITIITLELGLLSVSLSVMLEFERGQFSDNHAPRQLKRFSYVWTVLVKHVRYCTPLIG